ncbi:MAG: adenylate/guanylate cyclase domain-containing protein [Actinomycetota bacterium]|nr:adenylate/guanylate cyclase domain-containing protein [Actinomycetota bacterium]
MKAGELPSGTITFLFTDIEGSTRLLQRLGQGPYRVALEHHGAILREAISEGGGLEVSTEGDSFFAVFTSAAGALSAAVAAQRSLARHAWGEGGSIRVRMGLHTGQGLVGSDGYVGLDVHRAARIAEAGHGGQILLSETVRALVDQNLPPGVTLRDLGEHRLKDLSRLEHLYQAVVPELAADFPPLRSLDVRPHNLPAQLTEFVGRGDELAMIEDLLSRSRLLTLTGPGGTGKTRLALQAAAAMLGNFGDGAWFVPLAPIRDPDLLASTIARALQLAESPERPILDSLKEHLENREVLLVLDNFEQLLPAAPQVAELLEDAPALRVLVTSRSLLHLSGEQAFPVPPLEVPKEAKEDGSGDPQALLASDAVALFVQRARAADPAFSLTPTNSPAVARVVARLDGLPLAIELAAARVTLLPPEALLARLEKRFSLLRGAADLPARHRTLQDAIRWSYELLEPSDQALFRRLSVFVGGFSLEAAEAVASGEPVDDVLEGVASLLDKSVLRRRVGPEEGRFEMLETIREYAADRLAESGESQAICARRTHFFLSLVEEWDPELAGPGWQVWLERLEGEHDNLRASLRWAIDTGEFDLALRLGQAVWRFWHARGHLREARRWLEELLSLLQALPDSRERDERELELRTALGVPLVVIEGYGTQQTLDTYSRARELSERLGRPSSGPVLRGLALASLVRADQRRSYQLGLELLELAERSDDPILQVEAHYVLGVSSFWLGELSRTREQLELALAHYSSQRHASHVALYSQDPEVICLVRLGYVLWYLGYPEQALRKTLHALASSRERLHPYSRGYALNFAAWLANDCGDRQGLADHVAAMAELSEAEGLGFWESMLVILQGWLLCDRGEIRAGLAQMHAGLEAYRSTGQDVLRPYALSLIARAHCRGQEIEEGLRTVSEGLDMAEATGERFLDAELHRLRGELEAMRADHEEARSCFRAALEIARRQGARSLELRAATSLAKLELSHGTSSKERGQARRRLEDVYGWFTEGFSTADLQAAGAVLDGWPS